MSTTPVTTLYPKVGVVLMPTNFEIMRKEMERHHLNPKTANISDLSSTAFQGSISAGDAQTTVIVSFLTNREQIEAMLPPGKNLTVDGPPVVTVVAVYQGGIKWLAGRLYNLVLIQFPVVHSGKNGKTNGQFLPVVWENMTEPILMGREALGWPKIFAELPAPRRLGDTVESIAAWCGFTFLDINVKNLHTLTPAELKQRAGNMKNARPSAGLICHKFILKTGSFFETDADYLTISTNEGAAPATIREMLTGTADIKFIKGTFEQLPTMGHIVEKLAGLEIKQVFDADVVTQTGGGMGVVRQLI